MKPVESFTLLIICLLIVLGISVASQLSSDALAILATLIVIAPWSLLALAIVVTGMNRQNRSPPSPPPQTYRPPSPLPRRDQPHALPAPQHGRRVVIIQEPETEYDREDVPLSGCYLDDYERL